MNSHRILAREALSGPGRLAPHPDHLGEEVGAAGQHVELERLTAYYEGRITAAEREELQEHLSLCVRCSTLLRELHEFASDSDESPEQLEQEAAPPEVKGRILVNQALTLQQKGEPELALKTLSEAEPFLSGLNEPRLLWDLRFNFVVILCDLGQFMEAQLRLSEITALAAEMGNELDLVRVLWLRGRIDSGLGRTAANDGTAGPKRQRSSVWKEPASQPVATAERRLSLFRSAQRFFTETSAGLLRAVLRPFARGQRGVRLKIALGLELRDFDITHQRLLVYALAAFLNITPEEIVATTVEEGSVKVTVQLPAKAAKKLLAAFGTRDSSLFELLSDFLPIDASLEPQEHADRGIRPSSVDVGFEEFLKDVAPRLKGLLADYHIPIDDRDDIVQQALLGLLYQWEKIREPEPWLFGTIKSHCLMYWRRRRQDRENEKPEAMEDSSSQKAEGQVGLDDFLLTVSPPEEEILRYLRRVARGIVAT